MLTNAQSGHDSQLQAVVADLTKEYVHAESERRSSHRTPFVRPVIIKFIDAGKKSPIAFSKNISPVGIGLILEEAIPEGTLATLTIESARDRCVRIRSELRWCEPFGNGWHITGWKFITEVAS